MRHPFLFVSAADPDRSLDQIYVLEDLEAKIAVESRVVGEEFVDCGECLLAPLAADEGGEPAVYEEYLAIAFVVGQLF